MQWTLWHQYGSMKCSFSTVCVPRGPEQSSQPYNNHKLSGQMSKTFRHWARKCQLSKMEIKPLRVFISRSNSEHCYVTKLNPFVYSTGRNLDGEFIEFINDTLLLQWNLNIQGLTCQFQTIGLCGNNFSTWKTPRNCLERIHRSGHSSFTPVFLFLHFIGTHV